MSRLALYSLRSVSLLAVLTIAAGCADLEMRRTMGRYAPPAASAAAFTGTFEDSLSPLHAGGRLGGASLWCSLTGEPALPQDPPGVPSTRIDANGSDTRTAVLLVDGREVRRRPVTMHFTGGYLVSKTQTRADANGGVLSVEYAHHALALHPSGNLVTFRYRNGTGFIGPLAMGTDDFNVGQFRRRLPD
jgi:hypothetical protein